MTRQSPSQHFSMMTFQDIICQLEFMLPPVDNDRDLILEEENPEIYAHLENVLVHMIDAHDIAIFKSQKDYVRNKQKLWNIYITHKCGKSCQSYSPMQPLHMTSYL